MPSDDETPRPERTGDVALFIDWENFKYSLYEESRMPNIPALMEAVRRRYGRPVVARAYADWQDYYHRKSFDQMNLYHAGIEPVYVPARRAPDQHDRIKNSVDVRMSLDCLEVSFTDHQVETFVLVAGDADFLHVAAALRRRGKYVVMVGVSGSTSGRLRSLVDEMVFYDQDIDRVERQAGADREPPGSPPSVLPPSELEPTAPILSSPLREERPAPAEMTLEAAQGLLERLVREQSASEGGRNYPPLLSWLGLRMRERAPHFSLQKHGMVQFKDLVLRMQEQGQVLVETQGLVDRVWLPEDAGQVSQVHPTPDPVLSEPDNVPDDLRDDFADIVLTADDIQNSYREYMAKGLLGRFLYNKGHWDPADLPPQAAQPCSDAWKYRDLPDILRLIDIALDKGVLLRRIHVDSYTGNEIPCLELDRDHVFVRKVFAEFQAR